MTTYSPRQCIDFDTERLGPFSVAQFCLTQHDILSSSLNIGNVPRWPLDFA